MNTSKRMWHGISARQHHSNETTHRSTSGFNGPVSILDMGYVGSSTSVTHSNMDWIRHGRPSDTNHDFGMTRLMPNQQLWVSPLLKTNVTRAPSIDKVMILRSVAWVIQSHVHHSIS